MNVKQKNLPISLEQYTNIFNSILPFVNNLRSEYPLHESCVPINFFAYYIIKNNFSYLNAQFYIGHVIYDTGESILSYYDPDDYQYQSKDNWHTYILLENDKGIKYYLDFMSPLFNEIAHKKNKYNSFIEMRMFQKEVSNVKTLQNFLEDEVKEGDFYFEYQEKIFTKMINIINSHNKLQEKSQLSLDLYNSTDGFINLNGKKIKKAENKIITMW